MSGFMRFALLSVFVFGQVLSGSSVIYFNQGQWQSALNAQAANSLTNVSFASGGWTQSLILTPTYTELVSQSNTITVDSGYAEPGLQDNSTLGHASNGVWSDSIGKYGSTKFNFDDPILGFGGDFNIARSNGLDLILGDGSSYTTPIGNYDGFVGVVSDQPLTSLLITYGQNGCPQSFGNSYTLSNFQVAAGALVTPEPNLQIVFCGLVVMAVGRLVLKRT